MVTRKAVPVPPLKTSPPPNPPYPTSPIQRSAARTTASSNSNSVYSTDLATSPAFDLIDVREAQQRVRSDSNSSQDTWNSDGTEHEADADAARDQASAVPKPLKLKSPTSPRQQQRKMNGDSKGALPPSLRIGPAKPSIASPTHEYEDEAQANPWAGEQPIRSPSNPNNPYLRQNGFAVGESSQSAWQEVKPPPIPSSAPPPPPLSAPPPPPIFSTPSPPALPPMPSPPPPPAAYSPPAAKPVMLSYTPSSQKLVQLEDEDHRSASWDTVEKLPVPVQGRAPLPPVVSAQERPVSTWWQDTEPEQPGSSAFAAPNLPPKSPPQAPRQEPEYQPPPGPPPNRKSPLIDFDEPPDRKVPPIQTSPSPAARSTDSVPQTPGSMLQKQRNTTYQIRHVNWLDESYGGKSRFGSGLRNSPIMTQNANGPCPLLALVNALVLSTPHDEETGLIQVLSTREQISLGLLLDAVFEELMSTRRGGQFDRLPDVSELYAFLLALHTGMNVNPRFVTPASTPRGSWDGVPPELNGLHPMHRAAYKAGAFEETKEMRLYSTFNIPLIHGWTAPEDTPAYEAFVRSAQTFEDAQNIQFLQADLEEKMHSPTGLTPEETQTLEDIHVIKSFLDTWPTQLTDHGLETMSKSLQPGQIAILFRNDHFSTLYKEPKHGALMTLVTDAGYAGHDEVVWESLVDVSGAAGEMFSGDFRIVSHGSDVRLNQGNSGGGEEGWTTVEGKGRRQSSKGGSLSPPPPPLPGPRPSRAGPATEADFVAPMTDEQRRAAEQEDHDLALALQLQEEEENHQRAAEERRRREQELSEQFLSNENNEGPRPPIPPRRSQGRGTGATVGTAAPSTPSSNTPSGRPPVNRPTDTPDDPDAPPSYEQAAADPPYRPAGSTAAANLSQGNALGAYDALRRQNTQQGGGGGGGVNNLPSFAQTGPSSPPYTATASGSSSSSPQARRPSNSATNRAKRYSQSGGFSPALPQRTNQIGLGNPTQRAAVGQGGLSPGHYPGSSQARSMQRIQENGQATGVKDDDERCVVM